MDFLIESTGFEETSYNKGNIDDKTPKHKVRPEMEIFIGRSII